MKTKQIPKNIIKTMIAQHERLKKELMEVEKIANVKKTNYSVIEKKLLIFKKDLLAHLELENKMFYPALLEKLSKKKIAIEKTKKYINEMKMIEKEVVEFLDRYGKSEEIKKDIASFQVDLKKIISVLMLRITSEEDSIYMYWQF